MDTHMLLVINTGYILTWGKYNTRYLVVHAVVLNSNQFLDPNSWQMK